MRKIVQTDGLNSFGKKNCLGKTQLNALMPFKEENYVLPILFVRATCILIWTCGILYSTYHVFLAAEELLPWQRDPVMNPGPFTNFLNRGRDTTDFEWITFVPVLWKNLLVFYLGYLIIFRICASLNFYFILPWISPGLSFILLWQLCGLLPALFLFGMPPIYWSLLRLQSKLAIWLTTVFFILSMSSSWVQVLVRAENEAQYYFVVTAAWNYARCISFCFDVWNKPDEEKFSSTSLQHFLQYVFYLPLIVTGPLILYERFETQVIHKKIHPETVNAKGNLVLLGKTMFKLFLITILNELLYHYLYFRPLSLTIPAIYKINLWALCGTIYWLGQFFTLKYKVMYGIPSCLAEFDGLQMYPLPRCPAYIHRYSVLWKDFDRGLYYFLVRYIYIPSIAFLQTLDPENKFNPEIKKLTASFMSFVYVYIWHSTSFEVLVWSALNFLGITIERVGSILKKKIDAIHKLEPIVWDLIVEPIVTVPLAAMSILNSSVFCGTLPSAIAFANRLWISRADNYVFYFLFCFCHAGVTVRTWGKFSKLLQTRLASKKTL